MVLTLNKQNIDLIRESFSVQAEEFENSGMNFSKQEYLNLIIGQIKARPDDKVLEAASGTCICGRNITPYVKKVVCLDATPAMLQIGKEAAETEGIKGISFEVGLVEDIPYLDESFDIVLTRLSFHHFTELEKPFSELHRVLKPGGKLVIIDMEATEEALREIEDRIETMRDPSHIRNRSREEFEMLYHRYGYDLQIEKTTKIPVRLDAWMELTKTEAKIRSEILSLMQEELDGGRKTGFFPYLVDGGITFNQQWLFLLGIKRQEADYGGIIF